MRKKSEAKEIFFAIIRVVGVILIIALVFTAMKRKLFILPNKKKLEVIEKVEGPPVEEQEEEPPPEPEPEVEVVEPPLIFKDDPVEIPDIEQIPRIEKKVDRKNFIMRLTNMQDSRKDVDNWRGSVVDFYKLLGKDSSYEARKAEAEDLGYQGPDCSSTRNMWLHGYHFGILKERDEKN